MEKLKTLPKQPGVYFFKDKDRKIIYIGKAAVLKNRVSSYFQATAKDPKTTIMITYIADVDWITVGSEVEALFLESEMIKRYLPQFNIALRDEKQFTYIRIGTQQYPVVSFVRRPLDDKAAYFGPFTESMPIRRAMKMLRKIFPYVTHEILPARACLQAHIGLCPNAEEGEITPTQYKQRNLRNLTMYLSGQQGKVIKQIEKDMHRSAKKKDYEAAGHARDQLRDLRALSVNALFSDKEAFDLSKDQALQGLADKLGLKGAPHRIEAYDISHMSGTDNVASMVVFTNGVPARDQYRKFKMRKDVNDDFLHMREVISRRFSKLADKDWPKPDLILIDGGKGQLSAALESMTEKGIDIPAIGLAKRIEEIIQPKTVISTLVEKSNDRSLDLARDDNYEIILLPHSSHVLQLLQRVRDEAHRFAVTYHSLLRSKRQVKSAIDLVPGIGPATRKKLIKTFGSLRGVQEAPENEVAKAIGPAKAKTVKQFLIQ